MLKRKFRDLSIRKTICLYMAVNLFISLLLAGVITHAADRTQQEIWWKYLDQEAYFLAVQGKEREFIDHYPRINNEVMSRQDQMISELCDFLMTWSILILSVLGSIAAVFLFYQNKLKVPLEELENGSKLIAGNDLDFIITYSSGDEIGKLCVEFERMRGALAQNNHAMWKLVEQEKTLRAAIAHDIRSPLAILKGYQEMMLEFVPSGELDEKRIMEMLEAGMNQIEHLSAFIDTMRRLNSVEDRPVERKEIGLAAFAEQLKSNAALLAQKEGKDCEVRIRTEADRVCLDTFIVSEVLENLLTNALRYAAGRIDIVISDEGRELSILVEDDGAGFQESAGQVMKAYYHANPQDDLNHFGLGLYISRLYCEKHGGRLLLENRPQGGARAKAVFLL